MRKVFVVASLAILGGLVMSGTASADAKKGEIVFHRCMACHSVEKGQNKVGPSLYGVVGRKAASLPDYTYSSALKKSGLTWDEATLTKWLQGPMKLVPGTKMAFPGLHNPQEIADVIDYLKQDTK
ncbi:MAG: c-type cytochrome [Pararhizobium sp.]